jgi:hypothetical protein
VRAPKRVSGDEGTVEERDADQTIQLDVYSKSASQATVRDAAGPRGTTRNDRIGAEQRMPVLDQYGNPMQSAAAEVKRLRGQINRLRARYDAARTYAGNQQHWANADRFSPDAANSYNVRQSLRSRSRYELVENNSYLKGMVLTKVNDLVGSGPKLQVMDPRLTDERAQMIEQRFHAWSRAIRLRRILWQMTIAKIVDGEAFAIEATNPRLAGPVKMDLRVIEADQCTTQGAAIAVDRDHDVDGIEFDTYDNPRRYYILRQHPGTHHRLASSNVTGPVDPGLQRATLVPTGSTLEAGHPGADGQLAAVCTAATLHAGRGAGRGSGGGFRGRPGKPRSTEHRHLGFERRHAGRRSL